MKKLMPILALSTILVSPTAFSASHYDSEEEIKEVRVYDRRVPMQGTTVSPRASEYRATPLNPFSSFESLFGFLIENEHSPAPFAKDILEVTQAEPDIPRQIVYVLDKVLASSFVSNQELKAEFDTLKTILNNPEALVHREASFYRDKKTLLSSEEEEVLFEAFDKVTQRLINFKEKLNGASGKLLGQHQERILASLDRVITFYSDYRAKLLQILNSYCTSEGEDQLRFYHQLEDFLKPKALMTGEDLGTWSFWRLSQQTGRYIVGVDQYGIPLKFTSKDEGKRASNHHVNFLPNSSSQAKVYFKLQGHPSLNLDKEAIVQSLYHYLQIPVPATKIIAVKNLFETNPSAYLLQASQAINGQSVKSCIKSDPILKGLDIDSYAQQVLGAFLTYPSDGKVDNFIYQAPHLISIDNSEVFVSPFTKEGDVQVKSFLYLLPQMTEVIPPRVRQLFSTIVPEVIGLSFLRDLQRKNTAWQQLRESLDFLEGIERKEILSSNHVNWAELAAPVRMSSTLFDSIIQKINAIQKELSGKKELTLQALFDLTDPLLGRYYEGLRKAYPNPDDALHILYTPGNKPLHSHAQIFGLVNENFSFSDGRTARQHFVSLNFAKQLDELPEVLLERLKSSLQKQFTRREALPLADSLVETFRQRKKARLLERSYIFELFQNLQAEGLCTVSQSKPMLKLWEEIRDELSNGSQDQLMWDSLFQPFRDVNSELAWIFNLATDFPKRKSNFRFLWEGDQLQEILGVTLGKRQLSKEVLHQVFDSEGKFEKSSPLTDKRGVISYPITQPRWFLKKYPEAPGYEYAVTSFMRQLGIEKIPFSELCAFYDPQGSLYPVLISEAIPGSGLHEVWDNDALFSKLDFEQTALLILASMLLNPEDAREDNFILSQQGGKWVLVPINNDHEFLPRTIYATKRTLVTAIHESPQAKSLLFCLPQMLQTISPSIRKHFCEFDIDTFLREWRQDLTKVNRVYESFFPEEMASMLWDRHGSTMRMPLSEVLMENLYAKFYRLQKLILENPNLTLLDLLKEMEPYVGKCYEGAFTRQLPTVRDRFKFVTDIIYQRTKLSGFTYRALQDGVREGQMAVSLLTLKLTRRDFLNAYYERDKKTIGLSESKGEMRQISSLPYNLLFFPQSQYLSVLVFGEPDLSGRDFNNMKIEAYAIASFFNFNELDTKNLRQHQEIQETLEQTQQSLRLALLKYQEMFEHFQKLELLKHQEIPEQPQGVELLKFQGRLAQWWNHCYSWDLEPPRMIELSKHQKILEQSQRLALLKHQEILEHSQRSALLRQEETSEQPQRLELKHQEMSGEPVIFHQEIPAQPQRLKPLEYQETQEQPQRLELKHQETQEESAMFQQLYQEMWDLYRSFDEVFVKFEELYKNYKETLEMYHGFDVVSQKGRKVTTEQVTALQLRSQTLKLSSQLLRQILTFKQLNQEILEQSQKIKQLDKKILEQSQRFRGPVLLGDVGSSSLGIVSTFTQQEVLEQSQILKLLKDQKLLKQSQVSSQQDHIQRQKNVLAGIIQLQENIDILPGLKDTCMSTPLKVKIDSAFLDYLSSIDCVLTYTTWPIRKQYYLTAKEEMSKDVSLDLTNGLSNGSHDVSSVEHINIAREVAKAAAQEAAKIASKGEIEPPVRATAGSHGVSSVEHINIAREVVKAAAQEAAKIASKGEIEPPVRATAAITVREINERSSYYVAQVLENFCEVHPVFSEVFRQGNYHPLSLAASSESAKFNPEYEGE